MLMVGADVTESLGPEAFAQSCARSSVRNVPWATVRKIGSWAGESSVSATVGFAAATAPVLMAVGRVAVRPMASSSRSAPVYLDAQFPTDPREWFTQNHSRATPGRADVVSTLMDHRAGGVLRPREWALTVPIAGRLDRRRQGDRMQPIDPGAKADRTIDARGFIVMSGGVDIHCHIAGSKVNAARALRPEEKRANGVARRPGLRSGTLGSVPSTFATGYAYAGLGYTTAIDAAIPPLGARHAHHELRDTPLLDKGFLVLMGNNHAVMDRIREDRRDGLRDYMAWLLGATRGYGVKVVDPGGVESWKQGRGQLASLDDTVAGFDVTPRQILVRAALECGGRSEAAASDPPARSEPGIAGERRDDAGDAPRARWPPRPPWPTSSSTAMAVRPATRGAWIRRSRGSRNS